MKKFFMLLLIVNYAPLLHSSASKADNTLLATISDNTLLATISDIVSGRKCGKIQQIYLQSEPISGWTTLPILSTMFSYWQKPPIPPRIMLEINDHNQIVLNDALHDQQAGTIVALYCMQQHTRAVPTALREAAHQFFTCSETDGITSISTVLSPTPYKTSGKLVRTTFKHIPPALSQYIKESNAEIVGQENQF